MSYLEGDSLLKDIQKSIATGEDLDEEDLERVELYDMDDDICEKGDVSKLEDEDVDEGTFI